MKLSKRKNLLGFIYALVMLLPFSAILVRCLYITFNKNAYLSYSQITDTIITRVTGTYNATALSNDFNYTFVYNGNNDSRLGANVKDNQTNLFEVCNIDRNTYTIRSWNSSALPNGDFYIDVTNIQTNANSTIRYTIVNDFQFTCVVTGSLSIWGNTPNTFNNLNFSITFIQNNTGKLDNAFDYSLHTFLEENGSGQLNLTDWFTDIFLSRTTHNMLYLNYVNWYMNYSLLVSCVYLLYSVLMWFLTFARYVINKPLKEEE